MYPALIVFGIFGFIVFMIVFAVIIPVQSWIAAIFSGVKLSLFSLVGMRFRRIPPNIIINSLILSKKAGLDISCSMLEEHFLAGGNIFTVVSALIAANKANLDLDFQKATAIDLAGRDVYEAVKMSVLPKVIETPLVAAVAKDGIQVKAIARVTVRTNIQRLIGGSGEETILARVGEGIVTTIGSSDSHKDVLENPDRISDRVLEKGLDSGTAYDILSIDIADVDVGSNIGAQLQMDQAEADKNIAQARAEEKRAMAVALEQEMQALIIEKQAKVVEAETEVPLALAESLTNGSFGIMDYYKMKNVMADTDMRSAIADTK